eukprot:s8467_g2.t1
MIEHSLSEVNVSPPTGSSPRCAPTLSRDRWVLTEDVEQDRLSRAQAAFGGETLARMKDINVLVLGCRGVGVETAKNLILSNVGSVSLWDPSPATAEETGLLGANFYLTESSAGKPRAVECLAQLKSLNPYCKVEVLSAEEAQLPGCLAEVPG